ncbi:MAG: DUF2892 domain-containing protein [Planctomycetota bacterium]|nr:MAG: DUF2892 domain-containing protein [Planctomycetota bacterium]
MATTSIDRWAENELPWADAPAANRNVADKERHWMLLGGAGLAAYGVLRGGFAGLGAALLGGALMYRGYGGYCPVYQALGIDTCHRGEGADTAVRNGVRVRVNTTVQRPPAEVYRLWRDLENLPRFLKHLESVRVDGDTRSHWIAMGPLDRRVEWDAEIIHERENEMISWRSLPGSEVDSAGSVRLNPAPADRGTEVRIQFNYDPPGGRAGAALAWFFGRAAAQQVKDDLHRFKAFAETGSVPVTDGQPQGPRT